MPSPPTRPAPLPVLEASLFIAAAIFSLLLVVSAIYGPEEGTRKGVRVQMLESLASTLGPTGSIGLSALLLVGTGVWLVISIRAYRRDNG